MSYSLTVLSFRQSASNILSITKRKKRYSGCFFLLCSLRALLEPNFLSHLEQGSSRWFFRLRLLKTLAFWKSFSHLVHYMHSCLVFLQSFTTSKGLSTFYAQVFIWDEIRVVIVPRPHVLIQCELFVENFVTQVAREGFCCKSVVPLIMAYCGILWPHVYYRGIIKAPYLLHGLSG